MNEHDLAAIRGAIREALAQATVSIPKRGFTQSQAADYCGFASVETFRKVAKQHEIPALRASGQSSYRIVPW